MQTSRGCSCLRCTNQANSANYRRVWHPAIPTHPPNYLPTEATEPTEVSDARYSPTDCTDVHRLGGYGIPAIPTQPTKLSSHRTLRSLTICVHLCASVGGSSTPEVSVNSVNSVGELQCWCTSARLVQRRPLHPLGGRRGYGRDAIPSYDRSVGRVATQRGHGGMPCPLMSLFCGCTVYLVGAAGTAAPPERLLNEYLLNLAVSSANDV